MRKTLFLEKCIATENFKTNKRDLEKLLQTIIKHEYFLNFVIF